MEYQPHGRKTENFDKHYKPSQAIIVLSLDCTTDTAFQNANVLSWTVISFNPVCLLHSSLESAGSLSPCLDILCLRRLHHISLVRPSLLLLVCWNQYMYHWIPLKVPAFGWGKPSFQLYLCHFLSLWLWTSTSTSWEFNSPFRRGKVSSHGWGSHETTWKAIWKCKVLPLVSQPPSYTSNTHPPLPGPTYPHPYLRLLSSLGELVCGQN